MGGNESERAWSCTGNRKREVDRSKKNLAGISYGTPWVAGFVRRGRKRGKDEPGGQDHAIHWGRENQGEERSHTKTSGSYFANVCFGCLWHPAFVQWLLAVWVWAGAEVVSRRSIWEAWEGSHCLKRGRGGQGSRARHRGALTTRKGEMMETVRKQLGDDNSRGPHQSPCQSPH